MTWYVTDKKEYLAAGKDVGRASANHRLVQAAMTAVESGR